jgi:hypothetical protein
MAIIPEPEPSSGIPQFTYHIETIDLGRNPRDCSGLPGPWGNLDVASGKFREREIAVVAARTTGA